MTRRTLTGWACAGLFALGSPLTAKPPELPARPTTDGTAPTPMEQDHFQTAKPVAPKLLPAALRDGQPGKYDPPMAVGTLAALLTPFDAVHHAAATTVVSYTPAQDGSRNDERRPTVTHAGDTQSAEPPFAAKDAGAPDLAALQLKVLREAARQYRDAVAGGDKTLTAQTGKTLDAVLKQTKND